MRLLEKWRGLRVAQVFTIYTRYLIGGGFTMAALVKVQGLRFTTMSTETPVGYFFEAMFQTGAYWQFLGWSQLIAALLLMTQRFAAIGAAMFFGIILNIFVITMSVDFGMGTPIVTGLMLLATTYLLVWDLDKFAALWRSESRPTLAPASQSETIVNDPWWAVLGLVLFAISVYFGLTRAYMVPWFLLCVGTGLAGLVTYFVRKPKSASVESV